MIRRYVYFLSLLALFLFVAASQQSPSQARGGLLGLEDVPDRSKIIKFSHKYHIEEFGTECIVCHEAAATSTLSSENLLGTMADCATCHDIKDEEQCLQCHIDVEILDAFQSPAREIIFSHEAHVSGQNLVCETCHKGLEKVSFATPANMPDMATCYTCHNNVKATNVCESCHTDFVTLLPADHRESDFLRNHREFTRLGGLEASCQTCHTETFCQDCHLDGGLKAFGPRDLMTDPRPKVSTRDHPAEMTLQRGHELNYRFTHGIDARARQAECASCHSTQTFCAECHETGGNVTQGTFKPASHSVPGFTTLGFGSGGGLHAEEARRDIESCMSCHDVEGQDPSCMTCHLENGRVR